MQKIWKWGLKMEDKVREFNRYLIEAPEEK